MLFIKDRSRVITETATSTEFEYQFIQNYQT